MPGPCGEAADGCMHAQLGAREQELAEARQQEQEVLRLAFSQFRGFLCRAHTDLAAAEAGQQEQQSPAEPSADGAGGEAGAGAAAAPGVLCQPQHYAFDRPVGLAARMGMRIFQHTGAHRCSMCSVPGGAGEEQAALQATFDYTLACLRAFARRYYRAVAVIAEDVERSVFPEGEVPQEIRTVVIEALHV